MRIVMIGAGAMGSVFGAALARGGADVVLFDRNAAHVAAIQAHGLVVEGLGGGRPQRLVATTAEAEAGPGDLAIVFVDSANVGAAAEIAGRILQPDGFAVTLQNGIGNVEALVAALGEDRVAAGSTYCSAAFLGSGRVLHSNVGPTVIGEVGGGSGERLTQLAAQLSQAGLPTEAVPGIMGHVWKKFVLNCAINPITAVTGMRAGEVARFPPALAVLEALIDEILAVVAAKGVRPPIDDMRAYVLEHAFLRYNRPSMLQHVEAGREPEIPALNGALVREAEALGVAVPVNCTIAALAQAIAHRVGRRLEASVLDEAALEAAAQAEWDARSARPGSAHGT